MQNSQTSPNRPESDCDAAYRERDAAIRERDEALRQRDEALEALARLRATHERGTQRANAGEALFRLMVESVEDYAIFMLDANGRIATWNKGAERIKGYRDAEILGKPYETFFTPEDVRSGKPQKLLAMARERGHIEDQGWRMRKDGSKFWVDAVITAIRDEKGRLTGYAKVTRDLTELKQSEAERERLQKARIDALQQADELKDQFISILSHELRTPINAITGFGSILYDGVMGPMTPQQRTYLGKMLAGADTLLSLVNDLLDMSRIQAGRFHLSPGRMAFPKAVTEVLESLKPLAEQKALVFVNEVPAALPDLFADDQRIRQVLINLVGNAIKFTPDGGRIRLRARITPEGLTCEIEDSGIGIAPEDLDKLFKAFTQVDMSSTRHASGTGLGLSISKSILEAHGGKIGARSAGLGHGSTFWFILPPQLIAPPTPALPAQRAQPAP